MVLIQPACLQLGLYLNVYGFVLINVTFLAASLLVHVFLMGISNERERERGGGHLHRVIQTARWTSDFQIKTNEKEIRNGNICNLTF